MQGCASTNLHPACIGCVPASVRARPNVLIRCLLVMVFAFTSMFTNPVVAVYGMTGDLAPIGNPDNVLNVADVLILQRMVLGDLVPSQEQLLVGDVAPVGNPDGELNAADVAVLMRAVHGMVSLPPVYIRPDAPVVNELPSETTANPLAVNGSAVPGIVVRIYVNGAIQAEVAADGDGQFVGSLNLFDGANSVSITTWDGSVESDHSTVMNVEYTNVLPRSLTNTVITENAVWTPGNPAQPYVIAGNLVVSAGITLTLMPGAELVFMDGAGLQVLGSLEIDGATDNPVHLTAQTEMPGRWLGLSADSASAQLRISNANIKWASAGIRVENGATLDLRDTRIYGSQEYGVFVGSGAVAALLGATIEYTGSFYGGPNGVFENPGTGLRIEDASPLLQGNIIRHHNYGIEIYGSSSPRIENNNAITLNAVGIGAFGDYVDELNNPAPVIRGNTIADNSGFNYQAGGYVKNGGGGPEMAEFEQDLSGNWWGSADPNVISSKLDGFSRNWYNAPALKVTPFLDGPGGAAVPGHYLSGLVRQALTITNDQAPIVVGDLVIAGNGVLAMQAGVQLEVALQGGISSLGGLHLAGGDGTPITIKSHSTQPGAGDWRGLIIAGANASLRGVAIEHATTAVTVLSDQASITDCSLSSFSNWGVDVHGGLVVIEDSRIQGVAKAGVGVFLRTNTDTVLQRNQIDGLARAIDISSGSTSRIEANLLSGNTYGIYVGRTNYADPSARPDILNGNRIVDNDYGIYVKSYGANSWYADHQPRVNDNEIHGNAIYNYHADGFPVTTLLDATRNYWGSDDPLVIRAGISSDQVQYSPYTNSAGEIAYAGTIGPVLDGDMRIEPGSTLSLPNGLIIPAGRTLTVAPGVRIEVSPGKAIVVNGNIVVETGGVAPVFTVTGGAQNQYWKGFVINAPNQVVHDVTIEQATYGIEVLETSATVRDATFRGCATACIYAHGSYRSGALRKSNVLVERVSVELSGSGKGLYYFYANGSIYGSSITGALYGIEVAGSSSVVVKYNTLAGNGRGVYVHSGSSGGVIYDPSVTLNWNNVGQNINYAFYSEILQVNPGRQMGGQSNWWNTTVASEIPPKIFDANDGDSRRARFLYDPFSTSAIPLPPGRFDGAAPIATGQTYPVNGEGLPNGIVRIYVDGSAVADLSVDAQGQFAGAVPIAEGSHTLYAVNVVDNLESYRSREVQVTIDTAAPTITLVEPVDGIRTNRSVWTVRGQLSESATLTINGQPVTLGSALDFAYGPIALSEGLNTLDIVAVDVAGNQAVESVQVTVDSQPPPAIVSDRVSLGTLADGQLTAC